MSALSRAQYSQLITENRGKYAYNADTLNVSHFLNFVKRSDRKNCKLHVFYLDITFYLT